MEISMNIKNLFIFIMACFVTAFSCQSCMEPYCYCRDSTTLHCSNFSRFEELNFRLISKRVFKLVELRPLVSQLDLNEKLSFHGLKLSGRLSMSNIRSFSAFYNPFKQIRYDRLDLSFFNSYFTFVGGSTGNSYAEQTILENCEFTQAANDFDFVFSNLNLNELVICNVFFEKKMCPIIFRNSNIRNLIVNDPIGAYGFSSFKTPNNDAIYVLNTNINQMDFTYSVDNLIQPQWLDADYILNPELFIKTDRINLNAARHLAYIKDDTFKRLPGVRKFEINNVPLKQLLTYNRLWLKNLNYKMIPFDLDYISLNESISGNIFQLLIWVNDDWNFNEESDICLFKDFPHHRLVFPFLLFSKPTLPCTCTIYWLYKYFSKYQKLYNLNQNVVPFHCFEKSYWDKCHFETLFNKYCPDDQPDPTEPFTTLKPSVDFIHTSTPCPHCTTTYYRPPTYVTYITLPTITYYTPPPIITTTPTTGYYTSSNSQLLGSFDCNFSVVAFWLAIALCILAAFIVAALIILYYKVWRKQKPETICQTQLAVEVPTLIVSDIDTCYRNVCASASGSGYGVVTVTCNGTCADCNAVQYI